MKAPSKKVSIVIIIAVLVVTGIISISKIKESKKNTTGPNTQSDNLSINLNLNDDRKEDSDNDGLLNWEELLWGTNPNNPDTDGDGTNDGDEVEQNRNPLVSGTQSDDTKSTEDAVIDRLENRELDEDSLTNDVVSSFINEYFRIRQSGPLDDDQLFKIAGSAASEAENQIKLISPYSWSEFNTFNTVGNKDKLLIFANNFLQSQKDLNNFIYGPSLSNNYQRISEIIFDYSRFMITLEVPNEIISQYVDLANNYYHLGQATLGIPTEKSDPLLALYSVNISAEKQTDINNLLGEIGTFFLQNGIIYEDGVYKLIN